MSAPAKAKIYGATWPRVRCDTSNWYCPPNEPEYCTVGVIGYTTKDTRLAVLSAMYGKIRLGEGCYDHVMAALPIAIDMGALGGHVRRAAVAFRVDDIVWEGEGDQRHPRVITTSDYVHTGEGYTQGEIDAINTSLAALAGPGEPEVDETLTVYSLVSSRKWIEQRRVAMFAREMKIYTIVPDNRPAILMDNSFAVAFGPDDIVRVDVYDASGKKNSYDRTSDVVSIHVPSGVYVFVDTNDAPRYAIVLWEALGMIYYPVTVCPLSRSPCGFLDGLPDCEVDEEPSDFCDIVESSNPQ